MKSKLTFIGGVVLGVLLTFIVSKAFWPQITKGGEHREGKGEYKFINPLLECEQGEVLSHELRSFKDQISAKVDTYISQKKAKIISVYFRDLNNGPWFGVNEKATYIPASLLKVPIMLGYLKKAEEDGSILNERVAYEIPIHDLTHYVPPPQQLEVGKSYTVLELIARMIQFSDNTSKDLLLRHTQDKNFLPNVLADLGVAFKLGEQDEISVKNYASFFRVLFNSSYLSRQMSEGALAILNESGFAGGITAGVPRNVPVAHKFGERWPSPQEDKQLHDCGIVYFPEHPYLLCIMTRGDDFSQLDQVIKELSEFVYGEVKKEYARFGN